MVSNVLGHMVVLFNSNRKHARHSQEQHRDRKRKTRPRCVSMPQPAATRSQCTFAAPITLPQTATAQQSTLQPAHDLTKSISAWVEILMLVASLSKISTIFQKDPLSSVFATMTTSEPVQPQNCAHIKHRSLDRCLT